MSILCIAIIFGPVKHSTTSRIFWCSIYRRNTESWFISCILFTDFLSFTSYITVIPSRGALPSMISLNLKDKENTRFQWSLLLACNSLSLSLSASIFSFFFDKREITARRKGDSRDRHQIKFKYLRFITRQCLRCFVQKLKFGYCAAGICMHKSANLWRSSDNITWILVITDCEIVPTSPR